MDLTFVAEAVALAVEASATPALREVRVRLRIRLRVRVMVRVMVRVRVRVRVKVRNVWDEGTNPNSKPLSLTPTHPRRYEQYVWQHQHLQ